MFLARQVLLTKIAIVLYFNFIKFIKIFLGIFFSKFTPQNIFGNFIKLIISIIPLFFHFGPPVVMTCWYLYVQPMAVFRGAGSLYRDSRLALWDDLTLRTYLLLLGLNMPPPVGKCRLVPSSSWRGTFMIFPEWTMNHSRPFRCLGSARLRIRSRMFMNMNKRYERSDQLIFIQGSAAMARGGASRFFVKTELLSKFTWSSLCSLGAHA